MSNIVDGMALQSLRIPGEIQRELRQDKEFIVKQYPYTISDKIIDSSQNSTTTEITLAIHKAENPNNEECNSDGCKFGIGPMQIVQSTFDEQCNGDVYNENDNIQCGIELIDAGQLQRWKQSAWDMPKHQGWLNRLSTTTREYALGILNDNELEKCSCLAYMRELGHDFPRVPDPSYLKPNSPPVIGGLILLDFKLPHIGEVLDFRPGVILYKERILFNGQCSTKINWISYGDKRIRGFYSP
uniref:Uncharacterized protein n=1 Tax=viral metagenome TaxID=1070528 RepID=A0A6H1ZTX5_9ZZZZ